MKIFGIAGIGVLLGSIASAQPTPSSLVNTPNVLQPSKPWNLNGNQAACQLVREFGTDENGLTLFLEQGAGPNYVDFWIEGSAIVKLPSKAELKLRMIPAGTEQSVTAETGKATGRKGQFVRWFNADAMLLDGLLANQRLSITDGKTFTTTIELPGIKPAISALRNCVSKLLKSWGADPEETKNVAVSAKPDVPVGGGNPGVVFASMIRASPGASKAEIDSIVRKLRAAIPAGSWVSDMDYPSDALRRGASGSVTMVLSLNPEGHVDGCRIVVSSQSALLDQTSCEKLHQRAKYKPARLANGEAVRSTTIERIRWIIPAEYQ